MLHYKAGEWGSYKKLELDLEYRVQVKAAIVSAAGVLISAYNGEDWIPIAYGTFFNFRGTLEGFGRLRIQSVDGKSTFGIRSSLLKRQVGEPLDHEKTAVVPAPTGGDALLRQVRDILREEMAHHRITTMEPDADAPNRLTAYDHDDEQGLVFEEEEIARAKEEREKRVQELDAELAKREADFEEKKKALETKASEKASPDPREKDGQTDLEDAVDKVEKTTDK